MTDSHSRQGDWSPFDKDPMAAIRAMLPAEIAKGHECATCGASAAAHKIRGGFCPWMPTYKAPVTQP